jgi:predicted Zn-dependent protease
VRVRLVQSDTINAKVAPNGAIWVFSGLLRLVRNNDELATVLGYELAHFTHEHTRRQVAKRYWTTVAANASTQLISGMNPGAAQTALLYAQVLTTSALNSHYSRENEDQADRVGLRYAAEGGFDITQVVPLWQRLLSVSADQNRIENFFPASTRRSRLASATFKTRFATITRIPSQNRAEAVRVFDE